MDKRSASIKKWFIEVDALRLSTQLLISFSKANMMLDFVFIAGVLYSSMGFVE
jgi:hypothetical protein